MKTVEKNRYFMCAKEYLNRHNFKIVAENFETEKGKIDFVGIDQDDNSLVFVEVKIESNFDQSIGFDGFTKMDTSDKARAKAESKAFYYLLSSNHVDKPMRFDVVSITRLDGERAIIRHHVNAFGVVD